MNFDLEMFSGDQLDQCFEQLADLRIQVFKEFPYLYEGTIEYERDYLKTYRNSPRGLIIIAKNEGQVIGASTCIPLADESKEFIAPFRLFQMDPEKIFYFGESIILPEFRGRKLGHEFFRIREEHAQKTLSELSHTVFCAVIRPDNHQARPENYRPLDSFWTRQGYRKSNMVISYPWKDIGENKETKKEMVFWMKAWNQ